MPLPFDPNSLPDISPVQMLKAVRLCIFQVTTHGQSFSLDGHELTRADLDHLRKLEKELMDRVAQEEAGGSGVRCYQVVF